MINILKRPHNPSHSRTFHRQNSETLKCNALCTEHNSNGFKKKHTHTERDTKTAQASESTCCCCYVWIRKWQATSELCRAKLTLIENYTKKKINRQT